jgi:hypothetical protein
MKNITEDLKYKIRQSHSGNNLKPFKWDMIFDNEEELLDALFNSKIYTDEDDVYMYKWCRGYGFIKGFRKYYRKHGKLTDKQMIQLKRLACELAYNIYCVD